MRHIPTRKFQAYRLFTFRLDGQPCSKTIDHFHDFAPSVQSRQLQRRFYEWLEEENPGCVAAGRVTQIGFVDDVRSIDEVGISSTSTAA